MYSIGDRVVYPMHGAGVIEAIEEKEILGKTQNYYVLKMPYGDMKVMVPMKTSGEIGIRDVIGRAEADKVLDEIRSYVIDETQSWNKPTSFIVMPAS